MVLRVFLEVTMYQEKEERSNRHARRMGREEERLWSEFYHAVGNPTVAAELIAHMDQDDEARRLHSALYLRCRQSLRVAKERQARAHAVGKAIRTLLSGVFGWPVVMLMRCGRFCLGACEALLARHGEPAEIQLSEMGKRPMRKQKPKPAKVAPAAQAGGSGGG
jgi:hypothetical protein